jgi:hypothetical protein
MNVLWVIFVLGMTLWFLIQAIRRGYDPVRAPGFLGVSFGVIFESAIVVGLGLYGLSILLEGIKAHKSNSDKDDHSGDMANLVP